MSRGPTPFVGRADDLSRIRDALEARRHATLVGIGGIGKTRLAAEIQAERTAAGRAVVFCDLSVAQTASHALEILADALAVPGAKDLAQLGTLAARRDALVVVDNAESALDSVRVFVEAALACGTGQTLVASRLPLGLSEEARLEVGGLGADDAATLFETLSGSRWPVADLSRLVRTLDGIPLAIELAAARADLVGPAELASRFESDPDVLRDHAPERPARHHRLTAAIAESWGRLGPMAAQVLADCSVFERPFDLSAVEAVARVPGDSVLDALADLRRHSLVRADAALLCLLHPVRRYVQRHVRDVDALRDRHLDWALAACERDAEAWRGAGGPAAMGRMVARMPDARAAFEWAIERRPVEAGRMVVAWQAAMQRRGPAHHLDALDRVIERVEGPLRQACLRARIDVYATQMRSAAAVRDLAECEPHPLVHAQRAWFAVLAQRFDEADGHLALALRARCEHPWDRARVTDIAARVEAECGRLDVAVELSRVSLATAERHEMLLKLGGLLNNQGVLAMRRGDLAVARLAFERGLPHAEAVGDTKGACTVLANLGVIDQAEGDLARAREMFGRSFALHRAMGLDVRATRVEAELACVDVSAGHFVRGGAALERIAATLELAGASRAATSARVWAVAALVLRGELVTARAAFSVARARIPPRDAALRRRALCVHAMLHAAEAVAEPRRRGEAVGFLASGLEEAPRHPPHAQLRIAAGLIRRMMARVAPRGVLAVAADGSRCVLPDGGTMDLTRRPSLQPVLMRLVEGQRAREEALCVDTLFDAGWPGEAIQQRSKRDRVYQAVATLRKAGLGNLLQREGGGYRLPPDLVVAIDSDQPSRAASSV